MHSAGKLPPQAVDMEKAVLGALLIEDCIYEVSSMLSAADFYRDEHRLIYEAIMQLDSSGGKVDLLTVTDELRRSENLEKVGGPFAITELTQSVASAANVQYHAAIIREKALRRELIVLNDKNLQYAYDESSDIQDLIDSQSLDLVKLVENVGGDDVTPVSEMVNDVLDGIARLKAGELKDPGIPTLTCIDRYMKFETGLTIIAARPSMGKTSFVISLINNIAVEQKVPTAMFELEMPKKKLLRWMLSQRTGIDNSRIKKAELSEEETHELERAGAEIHQSPLYLSDNPSLTISQIRSKSIMLKRKHGVRIIFVDYLQLMRGGAKKYGNRNEEVSEISRGLKNLSTELDIPVVALSQLSRAVEARGGDKRPTLADLRDSGAIEQDADVVMFLHRPIKYGLQQFHDGTPTFNRGEVIIDKNRDGGLANDIRLEFIPDKVTWQDIPDEIPESEYNPDSWLEPDKEAF